MQCLPCPRPGVALGCPTRNCRPHPVPAPRYGLQAVSVGDASMDSQEDMEWISTLQSHCQAGRLHLLCTKCDFFDADRTAPEIMVAAAMQLGGSFRRLWKAVAQQTARALPPSESIPELPEPCVTPCSARALRILRMGETMRSRQRCFLEAVGFEWERDTGVPAVAELLRESISSAHRPLQPLLTTFGAILQTMEASVSISNEAAVGPPGSEAREEVGEEKNGLDALESLRRFESAVDQELDNLQIALEFAKSYILETGISDAEARWQLYAELELFPQLRCLPAQDVQAFISHMASNMADTGTPAAVTGSQHMPTWMAALPRSLRNLVARHRGMTAAAGAMDITAGLVAAYLGEDVSTSSPSPSPSASGRNAVPADLLTAAATPKNSVRETDGDGEFAVLEYGIDRLWWSLLGGSSSTTRGTGPPGSSPTCCAPSIVLCSGCWMSSWQGARSSRRCLSWRWLSPHRPMSLPSEDASACTMWFREQRGKLWRRCLPSSKGKLRARELAPLRHPQGPGSAMLYRSLTCSRQ
mmetsp:Transcript_30813/g.87160  ORF Transcript_30813/g.87160 Transcript_30813/m.87160 type:complete len:529 (-) Transcript_30813:751-2337(-)